MRFDRLIRQKRYALLTAALLLLSNALVTAHAFGEVDHAVKDGCQLLHQVERQPIVPAGTPVPLVDIGRYALPLSQMAVAVDIAVRPGFRSRAPPLA